MELEKEKRGGLGFIGGLLTGVAATSLVVVLGYGIGQTMAEENQQTANTQYQSIVDVEVDSDSIINKEFLQKVATLEALIEANYYLDEVSTEQMREGAYEGIVDSLGDIYSVYYTAEEAEEVFDQSEGIY